MQKLIKMDLANVPERTLSVCGKKGDILPLMFIRMLFFLLVSFCGTLNISFRQVTRECLRCYGQHLYESGLKLNTISTYMRMLRSIYNRGSRSGKCPLCSPVVS